MKYFVLVGVPVAPPRVIGRELARRNVPSIRAARAWTDRNSATWLGALDPGDPSFIALVTDEDGEPARSFEYPSDGSPPIEHDREDLEELRAMRGAS